MQGEESYIEQMTYPSPDTGERVGLSFLPPRNAEDLQKRRLMMELWAKRHNGF